MSESLTNPENAFFREVREILAEARRKAATSVNFIMVEAYWRIGARIVEQEQKGEARAADGQVMIKELSRRLGDEFGRGFSIANLKNFRQFYLTFPDSAKGYALRSELGWTHYRLIMRVEDSKARAYYLNEAASQGWTSRQLERNIRSGWHQRLLKAPDADIQEAASHTPESIFKDPYILEFLNLPENTKHHERDIETALIGNLQSFLLELGRGFSFVGRQFRIHFFRPEGPRYDSLGQRPRFGRVVKLRPEGPLQPARIVADTRCAAPLGLGNFWGNLNPGRCPGLSSVAPLGLKKILPRLAKLEDEITKGRKELEGLLG
jgi:predicted nuclease of restriction endonuclease-like (RecB) superfamily